MTLDGLLPSIAALARDGLPPTIGPLAEHERVFLEFLAKVEACIVDNVIFFHDVRLFKVPTSGGFFADVLHLGVVVRVSGGGKSLQQASVGEDERTGADGHEGPLFAGIRLLELGKILNQLDWLGPFGENVIYGDAAWNDQDIVFLQIFVSIFKVDVGLDGKT